jgi:hypothetical protein
MTDTAGAADFTVQGRPGDSVFLLCPQTEAASTWIEEHIPSDAMFLGSAVAVEHRYIGDIIEGIQSDELTVEKA